VDIVIRPEAGGEADRPARRPHRRAPAPAGHPSSPVPRLAGEDDTDPAESHIVRGID
jgi:hypothetical protein